MPILLLLAAAFPALAATVKPAGDVALTGVVEVPLYAGLAGDDHASYVEATVGDQKLLLRLGTGHRGFVLSESAVARLGLKATGPEGKKTVKIDSFTVGGATFTDVKADVKNVEGSGSYTVDGSLPLPGFEGLAYAVLPSSGVLKLAMGADGVQLVSGVGAGIPYKTSWKEEKHKVGKESVTFNATPIVVPVKWSGVEVDARLAIEHPRTSLAREIEGADWFEVTKNAQPVVDLPDAPGVQVAETRQEWREVGIGGVTVPTYVERPGHGYSTLLEFGADGDVGSDVLGALDLAVDPTTGTLAVKPAGASKRADYTPVYEASLRAALEPKPGADGAAPDEEAKKAARQGALGPLASFLEAEGRFDEAVTARKELADASPDDCTTWTSLGNALVSAGRPAEAIEPLTKAGALYQPWAQLPLSEREEISEAHAKAEKKKEEWTGQKPQDHACHVAPGLLALAQLQSKNAAAVAAIYPAQLDLDATLPVAAGSAALLQGQFDAAQAAYLQAIKLSGGANDGARVGLYLALAPKDFASARKQLERLRLQFEGETDPLLVRLYTEGVRAAQGAAGVKAALDGLLAADPGDAVLLAQRSKERAAAGDTAGAQADWSAAKARFEARLAASPNDADALAGWASALAGAGQAPEAQKVADAAVKLAPGSGKAWLAVADAAAAAGDSAKAAEARSKAGVLWASHPGYALLLAQ